MVAAESERPLCSQNLQRQTCIVLFGHWGKHTGKLCGFSWDGRRLSSRWTFAQRSKCWLGNDFQNIACTAEWGKAGNHHWWISVSCKADKAFPSVFQKIWDTQLKNENVEMILCGSLVHMMMEQTLSYSSLYTGAEPDRLSWNKFHMPITTNFSRRCLSKSAFCTMPSLVACLIYRAVSSGQWNLWWHSPKCFHPAKFPVRRTRVLASAWSKWYWKLFLYHPFCSSRKLSSVRYRGLAIHSGNEFAEIIKDLMRFRHFGAWGSPNWKECRNKQKRTVSHPGQFPRLLVSFCISHAVFHWKWSRWNRHE